MYFPTTKHRDYVEYMKKICSQNHLSLVLEGSLAHGTAKIYSDIDLILMGNLDTKLLDDIISGYDRIVMTNFTENPKGITILNYKNGISVDLDIRATIVREEIENNFILCDYGFQIADKKIRKVIHSLFIPERPQWYKAIRLIHRCCIKYLCEKTEAAEKLADEVFNSVYNLTNKEIVKTGTIRESMVDSLHCLNERFDVDSSIIELLKELFDKM